MAGIVEGIEYTQKIDFLEVFFMKCGIVGFPNDSKSTLFNSVIKVGIVAQQASRLMLD